MGKRKGILVINGGSTSVKFAGYRHEGGEDLRVVCRGQVEGIGSHPSFVAKGADGKPVDAHDWGLSTRSIRTAPLNLFSIGSRGT